jgi:hypothetical protein
MAAITPNSEKGTSIYARKDGIMSYQTPNLNDPDFDNVKTYSNDNIVWTAGELIGKYTGKSETVSGITFFEIEVLMYAKNRFLGLNGYKWSRTKVNGSYNPRIIFTWFQGSEIDTSKVQTTAEAKSAKKEKERADLEKLIEETLNGSKGTPSIANKGLFASMFGPTIAEDGTVTNNNLGAAVGVIVILVISIVGLVFLRKKQAKAAPQPLTIVQKNGKNYIVNPQTLK